MWYLHGSNMSVKRKSIVHSFSMFQPSLTQPNQTHNSYKPPLFTSSCNSILQDSRRSTTNTNYQSFKRSQSVRKSQLKSRSQSIGGPGVQPSHRLIISTQTSQEGSELKGSLGSIAEKKPEQKGSLGSIVERKTSVASISQHFSSFMSISSQVRHNIRQIFIYPLPRIIFCHSIEHLFYFICT